MRTLCLLLVLGALAATAVHAERDALLIGGCTMVPVRYLAESFGATVRYDTATKQVSVGLGVTLVNLGVDSPVARVDGRPVRLEMAATVVDGVTYVPVRFVCEHFGAKVNWDGRANRVSVLHPKCRGGLTLSAREHRTPPGQTKKHSAKRHERKR
jgi:hypothetical protein